MTVGKATLITVALAGAVAIGIAAGPTVRDSWSKMHAPSTIASSAPAANAPAARHARSTPARTHDAAVVKKNAKKDSSIIETVAVSAWDPEFRDRVKAVLNRGADLEIAAADFDTPEQFMTVAHAARNTQVPFMVLKDRVVNQGQPLAQAIHEFKPELDAKAEVARARTAAREDLAAN